jgi:competence protein ComEA
MTGAVKKPGVYKFPEGSRIFEVVEAAGGFTDKADIAALNLAETFSDAQHIHIPVKGERPRVNTNTNTNADTYTHITVQPNESNRKPNDSNLVDINNASEIELQRLKGVGPAIAKRIYEYRQKHGRFNTAEELINVRGIGPAKLEKMKPQIIIR